MFSPKYIMLLIFQKHQYIDVDMDVSSNIIDGLQKSNWFRSFVVSPLVIIEPILDIIFKMP